MLLPQLLALLGITPAHVEVYTAAYTYCLVIFLGIVTQIGYNLICGILRALGDLFSALVFLLLSTVLNVGLDLLFLIPLRMGPAGAAIATVLAQAVSLLAGAVYMLRRYPRCAPRARTSARTESSTPRICGKAFRSGCNSRFLPSALS